jgi:hypothetical protein
MMMLKAAAIGVLVMASVAATSERAPGADAYYVAKDGVDDPRNGSAQRPWATITYAVKQVPDGATILVRPGTYQGRVSLDRRAVKGIAVRAEVPYQVELRHYGKVIQCYGCEGITLEGFDVAHDGPGAGPLVIQIDGDGGKGGRRVVLRNNVLHDSFNNDILKINNGARDVRVTGNVFYNQGAHDEHIDVNSAVDVTIEDNVFFDDYLGSGRTPVTDAGSFIVIKDSNDDEDGVVGSQRIAVRRNVFMGWQGNHAFGFLLVGEDGKPYYEATDVTIENNLLLGDSTAAMRSPLGVKGGRDVVFRNNTVVGDLPGSAFATRLNREGDNRRIEGVRFYNNVWADPTGTMDDFSDTDARDVGEVKLSHNLYWNGGGPIPFGRDDCVNYTADRERLVADPRLRDPRGVLPPRWIPSRRAFADGSHTIGEARARLVDAYARPGEGSAVVDRADPQNAPRDDIRGVARSGRPDIGAYELGDNPKRMAATTSAARRTAP